MKYGEFTPTDEAGISRRIIALYGVWVKFKSNEIPETLRDCTYLDLLRLERAIGAYWNDLRRLKARHAIQNRLHRSKIAAYSIKWILHYSPIGCKADGRRAVRFSDSEKEILLEINQMFAIQCLFYFADTLDPQEFESGGRFARVMRDLVYYLGTGGYQEKMASVLFDALLAATPASSGTK